MAKKDKEIVLPTKTSMLYKGDIKINFYDDKKQHKYEVLERVGRDNWQTIHGVISVTACTGVIDKSGQLMNWAVNLMRDDLLSVIKDATYDNPIFIDRERILTASKLHHAKKTEAADIGTKVHEWAESYGKGFNPDVPKVDADPEIQPELYNFQSKVLNGVLAFLKWINANDVRFISTERLVYSRKYNYVGTMDCEISLGREKHRIIHAGDYKTAKGFYTSFRYQVAAYQQAVVEEFGQEYGDKILIKFGKEDGEFDSRPFGDHREDFEEGFIPAMKLSRREKQLKAEEKEIAKAIMEAEEKAIKGKDYISCR